MAGRSATTYRAFDPKIHLIVAPDVAKHGFDRDQLSPTAIAAKETLGRDERHANPGKGYSAAPGLHLPRDPHHHHLAAPGSPGNAATGMSVASPITSGAMSASMRERI